MYRESEDEEFLNDQIVHLVGRQRLADVPLVLDGETRALVQQVAEAGGWTFERALQLAFDYGVSARLQEQRSDAPSHLVDEANDFGCRYVALKYQVYKLQSEVFRQETRLNAAVSQNRTFEELIARMGGTSEH